jgi:LysR family transcriptional regulator, benzoate and cis,cis-muconate-responsive activator of ben and cat genes
VELRHLRYFLAVAETQNFTQAAQKLRVAQPALGRQIKDLEDELGAQLLQRSSRGAALTAAGEAFVAEAKAVLQRAEEAARVARAFAEGVRGELQLGYAPSPTVELLPRILHAYQSEAPGVRVVLHDMSTGEMLRGLHGGKLHVALMVKPGPKELLGLIFEELCRYPICAALSKNHKLARGKTVELRHLVGEPLVAYSRGDYPEYHEMIAEIFAPAGGVPRIAEEHDSATSLIAAVEAKRGVAIVPSSLSCLAGPRLRVLELRPAPEPLVVGAVYEKRKLCPASERFAKLLRAIPKAGRRV